MLSNRLSNSILNLQFTSSIKDFLKVTKYLFLCFTFIPHLGFTSNLCSNYFHQSTFSQVSPHILYLNHKTQDALILREQALKENSLYQMNEFIKVSGELSNQLINTIANKLLDLGTAQIEKQFLTTLSLKEEVSNLYGLLDKLLFPQELQDKLIEAHIDLITQPLPIKPTSNFGFLNLKKKDRENKKLPLTESHSLKRLDFIGFIRPKERSNSRIAKKDLPIGFINLKELKDNNVKLPYIGFIPAKRQDVPTFLGLIPNFETGQLEFIKLNPQRIGF